MSKSPDRSAWTEVLSNWLRPGVRDTWMEDRESADMLYLPAITQVSGPGDKVDKVSSEPPLCQ